MQKRKKFVYRNKKGELFPCDKKDCLQGCCDRYNKKLNDCYTFIEKATHNPMSPIQRKLNGEYYTSPFYKEFFGCWCRMESKSVKKNLEKEIK